MVTSVSSTSSRTCWSGAICGNYSVLTFYLIWFCDSAEMPIKDCVDRCKITNKKNNDASVVAESVKNYNIRFTVTVRN